MKDCCVHCVSPYSCCFSWFCLTIVDSNLVGVNCEWLKQKCLILLRGQMSVWSIPNSRMSSWMGLMGSCQSLCIIETRQGFTCENCEGEIVIYCYRVAISRDIGGVTDLVDGGKENCSLVKPVIPTRLLRILGIQIL